MKKTRIAAVIVMALVTGLGASSALAWRHGPRVVVGFNFGVPLYGAYTYPYPYYAPPYYYPAYYPAPVVVQQQPTVYVEQQPAPAAQASAPAGYWYYCAGSHAYYPYVKECPAGWQRVAPQPPN